MARLSIHSDRVRALVSEKIAPLLLATGSISGVCKALNAAIGAKGGELHPNRIHALLSDDIGRGINEATISLIEDAANSAKAGWSDRGRAQLAELAKRAGPLLEQPGLSLSDVAKRHGVPPAILRLAIGEAAPAPAPDMAARLDPDWTYQDMAVGRTLDALARRPTGAIGLVVPTGGGKSRSALRIALEQLARTGGRDGRIYWATHRLGLKAQAARELAKLLADDNAALPPDAQKLAACVRFVMVGELARLLEGGGEAPRLVIVDEAHHAAAPSYACLLEPGRTFPLLLLTATPNRPDGLPIGIDEIAYSITYGELARRGSILIPEFIDFPVEDDFQWTQAKIADLADYVVDEAADRFGKTLVLVSRVERVEEFYEALVTRLAVDPAHRLSPRDIGFVHGDGNSEGLDTEVFLERFRDKPQGIIVSAQLLLEGYDDPAIDAVIMTYPSTSMIKLMQAAGRAVRHHRGKQACYVVQAHNPEIAYRFDQRWLYQEIDDYLRPDLLDVDYGSADDLAAQVASELARHNVPELRRRAVLADIGRHPDETEWKLLFYGRSYYEAPEDFARDAEWGVFVETPDNRATFRKLFNAFCAMGAHQSDPSDFLATMGREAGVPDGPDGDAFRSLLADVLTAAHFARDQVWGPGSAAIQGSRPYRRHGPTSWLRYVTFHARDAMPKALADFLTGCYNKDAIERLYLAAPSEQVMALKLPLPLGGYEASLLREDQAQALGAWLTAVRQALLAQPPDMHFAILAQVISGTPAPPLAMRIVDRLEVFLSPVPPVPLLISLSNPSSQGRLS